MDDMDQFEAEFTPPEISGQSTEPMMCRECNTEPARSAGCQECREHDGGCLYCKECAQHRYRVLITRMMEISAAGDSPELPGRVILGLSWCDVLSLIGVLCGHIYGLRANIEEDGGESVADWLVSYRSRVG